MLSSNQKGAIAEASITAAAIKLGIGVLRPLSDGLRHDVVFDAGGSLLRVQCKWAARSADVVVVNCRTARRGPSGYIRSVYGRDEIDLIVAYCAELDRCYALPPEIFDGHAEVNLRCAPTRNSQSVGVKWARDYELGRLDFFRSGP